MTRFALYLALACLLAGAVAWLAAGWLLVWFDRTFGVDRWYSGKEYGG